jgi:hypothetical protein
MFNRKFAVAVAAAMAAGAAATSFAAPPTQAQAAAAPFQFYLAGSSAAVSGFGSALGADLCGGSGNLATFVTNPAAQPEVAVVTTAPMTPDFRAFSCTAAAGKPFAGSIITIYYRAEGGSVGGAFAPLNNLALNELNLNAALCLADTHSGSGGAATANQWDCATSNNPGGVAGQNAGNEVVGTSPVNGPSDNYTGAVFTHQIEYGISDLEPGAFGNSNGEAWAGNGNNDPAGIYSFVGTDATPDQLQAMPHSLLFQQSFGLVASSGLGISNIGTAAVASILAGTVTDWSKVVNIATGTPVTVASTPIVVCHRDLGSGTRTASDIFFETDGCNPVGTTVALNDLGSVGDSFSTGDVLACVNSTAGSIGYVSIDNYSKAGAAPYANTTALQLDGRTPSTKLTAEGGWAFAFEASGNQNPALNFSAGNYLTFYTNYLIPALKALATAPQSGQVNVLPGIGGNAKNGGTLQNNGKIYVTSYYRDNGTGNSCSTMLQH